MNEQQVDKMTENKYKQMKHHRPKLKNKINKGNTMKLTWSKTLLVLEGFYRFRCK